MRPKPKNQKKYEKIEFSLAYVAIVFTLLFLLYSRNWNFLLMVVTWLIFIVFFIRMNINIQKHDMYLSTLRALEYLLDRMDEKHWRDWMRKDIESWENEKSVEHHKSAYGGMGSFNDVYVYSIDGKKVDETLSLWANLLFNWMKSLSFNLSKKPKCKYSVKNLKHNVGYQDAPLSAFVGSKHVPDSQRKLLSCDNDVQVTYCSKCDYKRISYETIEELSARFTLGKEVFDASAKNKLILLVDEILSSNFPNTEFIKMMQITSKIIENSTYVFSERGEHWITKCPLCSSDDIKFGRTAITYYLKKPWWKLW